MSNHELFLAAMDGDLTGEELDQLNARLESDPVFRSEFEQYKKTVGLLRKVGPARAPGSLLPAIQRSMARRHRRRIDLHVRFPYELVVFLTMLAGVFYLWFSQMLQDPGRIVHKADVPRIRVELAAAPAPELLDSFPELKVSADAAGLKFYSGRMEAPRAANLLESLGPNVKSVDFVPEGAALVELRLQTVP